MFERLELTRMAQALAAHAGSRQAAIAQNVAQADTPGYRAVDLPSFAEVYREADAPLRATRARHIVTGDGSVEPVARSTAGAMAPNGNNVSLEGEMVKAVEVRQQHDMALAVYRSVSDVLRASLGRPR